GSVPTLYARVTRLLADLRCSVRCPEQRAGRYHWFCESCATHAPKDEESGETNAWLRSEGELSLIACRRFQPPDYERIVRFPPVRSIEPMDVTPTSSTTTSLDVTPAVP